MDKKDILKKNGTYNKNHSKVIREKFLTGGFYDPVDAMQVKYEMIRDADDADVNISHLSKEYGYTRTAFYNIKAAFSKGGMQALVPSKTGPKAATKLTAEVSADIAVYTTGHPGASAREIQEYLREEKGVAIGKRTIERHISKKKPH